MKNKFKYLLFFMLLFSFILNFNTLIVSAEEPTHFIAEPMPADVEVVFNNLKKDFTKKYYVVTHKKDDYVNYYKIYLFDEPIGLIQKYAASDKRLTTYFNVPLGYSGFYYQITVADCSYSSRTTGVGGEILRKSYLKENSPSSDFILDANYTLRTVESDTNGIYSSNIPDIKGLRVKGVTTKPNTDFIINWDNKNYDYHVDVMFTYSYTTSISGKVKYKDFVWKTYAQGFPDSGEAYIYYHSLLAIAKGDNSEDSSVIGAYGFTKFYLRYSDGSSSQYKFGNWSYVTIYGGKVGVIESGSGSTTYNDDGLGGITENPITERFDKNGVAINDGAGFGDLLNGIVNSPQILANLGNGISSLISGIGQVPLALGSLLIGFPAEIWTLISVGMSCIVAVGIFKLIRG